MDFQAAMISMKTDAPVLLIALSQHHVARFRTAFGLRGEYALMKGRAALLLSLLQACPGKLPKLIECRRVVSHSLKNAAEHGFQITTFLHMCHERMITASTGHFQNLCGTTGKKSSAANHIDKLFFTD